jgi:hypothetical protein
LDFILLLVAVVLFLFRKNIREVVGAIPLNGGTMYLTPLPKTGFLALTVLSYGYSSNIGFRRNYLHYME